jgi:hypothetical protein
LAFLPIRNHKIDKAKTWNAGVVGFEGGNRFVDITAGSSGKQTTLRSAGTRGKAQIIVEDSGYRCAKQER